MAEGDPEPTQPPPPQAEGKKQMEVKKTEDGKSTKVEEEKLQKPQGDDTKKSKEDPPLSLIILKVNLHCEGCARKVRRYLKRVQGVEDVQTDCEMQRVVVKGEKADPEMVLEKLKEKSRLQVELLLPILKPTSKKEEPKQKPKPPSPVKEEKQPPITVLLKVHMHCEACAREIQKRIKKMQGIDSAMADLKTSHVTVKGVFDPSKLVQYVYKKIGKHAVIVKQDSPPKEIKPKEAPKEAKDKKPESEEKSTKKNEPDGKEVISGDTTVKENTPSSAKEGTTVGAIPVISAAESEGVPLLDAKKFEYNYSNYPVPPPLYYPSLWSYQVPSPEFMAPIPAGFVGIQQVMPPLVPGFDTYGPVAYEMAQQQPQMFSDENPNACAVM